MMEEVKPYMIEDEENQSTYPVHNGGYANNEADNTLVYEDATHNMANMLEN